MHQQLPCKMIPRRSRSSPKKTQTEIKNAENFEQNRYKPNTIEQKGLTT